MKIIIFLLLHLSLYAQLVMQDGQCFERKGNMNYIVPCKQEAPTPIEISPSSPTNTQGGIFDHVQEQKSKNSCEFKMGLFALEYKKIATDKDSEVAIDCEDSLVYIKSLFLGYEKSLSTDKKKFGDLTIRRGFSTCDVELFYGHYIFIGVMSGDESMCNDFMVYHSSIKN